ncbi:uncharacterized protein EV422DRAFT_489688, partial [Fimicolochytrium jonesii]|uniref:uncharacterized protein n=1 Tax=Fimicolochytrium jonesii TaxID=1396493 RepID=UPI0022FE2054
NLWIHDPGFSKQDLVINPDCFPGCRVGDLLKITQPASSGDNKNGFSQSQFPSSRGGLAALSVRQHSNPNQHHRGVAHGSQAAEDKSRTLILQISIAQHIAAIFELHARKDVVVTKVEREAISADYVEICFRDQYLGRSDMWRMKTSLTGTCVYEGKKVSSLGIRAQIKDIVVSGRKASCGYINDNTKTIFRSETAKYFICIQMSKEMWEFDEDGELYFEKCVHGFLPQLFAKWKEAGANHVVSVVLFARIHYQTDEEEDGIPLLKDASGRSYRDFYKVVVDWAIRSDWSQILIPLEKEFVSFQRDVLQQSSSEGSTILAGTNSPASEGNVLEAINLALNPFDRHYIDRDLSRTGLGIVVITPGPGVYEVDKKLLRLTAHRMVDNGIGLDLVCLSKPPLCTVPLFQYVSKECPSSLTGWGSGQSGASIDAESSINSERRWASALGGATGQKGPERSADKMGTGASDRSMGTHAAPGFSSASGTSGQERRTEAWDPLYYDDATPEIPDKTFYTVPHWIMCSFWAREGEQDNKGFRLRCKMYEVQMMGVMEEIGSTIVIPYMEEQDLAEVGDVQNSPAVSVIDDFVIDTEQYDESVFLPIIKHQSMVIKNRSNSGMNVGGSSDVDSLASNKGVRGGSRLDLQHPYATTGGGSQQRVLAKTASNTSLTAEAAATAEKKRPAWASSAAQSSGGRTSAPVSRKSSVLASDTAYGDSHTLWSGAGTSPGKGDVRLSQPSRTEDARASVPQSLPIGANLQRAAIEDTDSSGLHSASTTLAPIRIRGNQQVGLRHPYREGLSTSGSFKSHSPLANYEYLRSQYPRVSPGKTSGSGGNMRAPTFQQTSFRSHLINPCNPSRNIIRATSQVLRWQHVFPQIILPMRNDFIIAWKSLSIPACLPLTTDFFPSPEDLQQLYQEYTYTVSAADDATPYQSRGTGRSDEGRGTQTTKVEGLLVDLVAQRLAQGFQLIIAGSTNLGLPGTPLGERGGDVPQQATNIGVQGRSGMQQAVHKDRSPSFGASTTPGTRASPRAYYLSLGDHVHKLSHDASGQNVEVKRYVRKVTYSTLPIQYACGIWRKHDTFYRPKQLGFSYPPVTSYNWNYLDHLISGYQEELTENLRFWRTRFLLIPVENVNHVNPFLNPQNDNLDEEEIRVVGFEKFIEVFEKSRWVPPWEEDDHIPKLGKKLQIQLTTLNTSRFIREEVLRRGLTRMGTAGTNPGGASTANQKALPTTLPRRGSATSPATSVNGTNTVSPTPLTRSSPFSAVAEAMQAPPPAGVAFGDRRWHFRLYERVFIGSECVEWMVRNFADIETPEEAVAYGNALLKEGFFEHANRKHRFLDGHYFYRVRGDFAKTPGTAGTKDKEKEKLGGVPLWFGNRAKSSTNLFDSNSGSSSPSVTTSSNTSAYPSNDALAPTSTNALDMAVQDSPQAAQTKSVRQAVEPYALTRRMVIDLDVQRRSPRRETAVLHYDTVHNPRHCYHYQIHWLACSPRWIEDLVAGWARVAEKCGFKMVEAGTSQAEPLSDDNPFQSVTLIKPCIPLPLHPKAPFPSSVYLTETVRRFNFVLDMEADSSLPTNAVTWSYDRGKGFKRTQWVHRSGVAFIQISSEDEEVGFWWVANRMHLTGSASVSQQGGAGKEARGSSSSGVDPDTLMKTFADFCNNEAEIRQFWDE